MGPFVAVQALWLFLPAYCANMAPVFAAKIFPGWKRPMDGGRVWRDGRRVFGPHKTWRGLWSGALVGAGVAWAQSGIRFTSWDLSDFGAQDAAWVPTILGFALGLGAGVGDAAKSFAKRRAGREGGTSWVPFDQLDFVLGGLLLALAAATLVDAAGLTSRNWFAAEFLGPRWPILLVLLLATPLLHFVVNVVGYKLGLKKVPW